MHGNAILTKFDITDAQAIPHRQAKAGLGSGLEADSGARRWGSTATHCTRGVGRGRQGSAASSCMLGLL